MPEKLVNFYEDQRQNLVLWLIFLFCLGSYLGVIFFTSLNIKFAGFLLFFSAFLYQRNRDSYFSLIFIAFIAVFTGIFSSYFNQKIRNNYNQITGKIFVDVKGEVADFKKFKRKNSRHGVSILIKNPIFYKSNFRTKKRKKPKKVTQKSIQSNFMNIKDMQEIDLEYIIISKNYQNINWIRQGHRLIYPKPPKKIRIFINNPSKAIKIGDIIEFKAMISPPNRPNFIKSFDFRLYNKAKAIAGQGRAISEVKIISRKGSSSIDQFFENLRKKIQQKIHQDSPENAAGVINALLTGDRNSIKEEQIENIRNSGLAHLIAISGLHLSLAAAIFFISVRFLLLQSQYLTLHFDIKKIAAIFAIFASYFYLKIAGSPISGQRAFIMIFFVMIAILFDKKPDLLRSVFFAALAITIVNPYSMFFASFQLSFAALLTITAFHKIWSNLWQGVAIENKIVKYPLEMIFISAIIQITTAPFLIYHFGNIATYGFISNLVAIPLTSFIIMPLGFLSLFLMPIGIAWAPLSLMTQPILIINKVAEFVSNMKGSHFHITQMNSYALALSIFSLIGFSIIRGPKIKFFCVTIFILSILTSFFTKKPSILIDGEAKRFALYHEDSLSFNKKVRKSRKVKLWLEKLNLEQFGIIKQGCNSKLCEIDLGKYFQQKELKGKKMLALLKRTKINRICDKNYEIILNLSKKYQLPSCAKANHIIDNHDILQNGAHFIYFDKKGRVSIEAIEGQKDS